MDDLIHAQDVAKKFRYSEDIEDHILTDNVFSSMTKDNFLRTGLLISAAVTPVIETRLLKVCERLRLNRNRVHAFVYNCHELNASLYFYKKDECVLTLSSSLVNLMTEEELDFVIAHELAHFLLQHRGQASITSSSNFESFSKQRAQELSADRIGFIGSGSLTHSLRAIIKTVSGLNNELLRFDVSSFISQLRHLDNPTGAEFSNSSHPPMLIRCRAVLWFASQIKDDFEIEDCLFISLKDIDYRISRELNKYVDTQLIAVKNSLSEDLSVWCCAQLIFEGGRFSREMQIRINSEFDSETSESLKRFFETNDRQELKSSIITRKNLVIEKIMQHFPESAEEIINHIMVRSKEIVFGK